MAITTCALEGDVDPVVAGFVVFPYQLIEQAEFEKMLYPLATDGDGWQMQVGSFAFHVLAGGDSSYCSVEGGTTVTAADDNWLAVPLNHTTNIQKGKLVNLKKILPGEHLKVDGFGVSSLVSATPIPTR